jgi:hypothetical protein
MIKSQSETLNPPVREINFKALPDLPSPDSHVMTPAILSAIMKWIESPQGLGLTTTILSLNPNLTPSAVVTVPYLIGASMPAMQKIGGAILTHLHRLMLIKSNQLHGSSFEMLPATLEPRSSRFYTTPTAIKDFKMAFTTLVDTGNRVNIDFDPGFESMDDVKRVYICIWHTIIYLSK